MNKCVKALAIATVLLILACLSLRQLSARAGSLGLHTLAGARCGNHICATGDEVATYMSKYQSEEHLYKYAAIATGAASCVTAGAAFSYRVMRPHKNSKYGRRGILRY